MNSYITYVLVRTLTNIGMRLARGAVRKLMPVILLTIVIVIVVIGILKGVIVLNPIQTVLNTKDLLFLFFGEKV